MGNIRTNVKIGIFLIPIPYWSGFGIFKQIRGNPDEIGMVGQYVWTSPLPLKHMALNTRFNLKSFNHNYFFPERGKYEISSKWRKSIWISLLSPTASPGARPRGRTFPGTFLKRECACVVIKPRQIITFQREGRDLEPFLDVFVIGVVYLASFPLLIDDFGH